MSETQTARLASMLKEAEAAHAEHEKNSPPYNRPAWPDFYADFLLKSGAVRMKEPASLCF